MNDSLKTLKLFLKNPGTAFYKQPSSRQFYGNFCNTMLFIKRYRRKKYISLLPQPDPELTMPRDIGFKRVADDKTSPALLHPLMERCQKIMTDSSKAKPKIGKSYLNHLVSKNDLIDYPEFINYVLNPAFLSAATQYLGELPFLGGVYFWHAHSTQGAFEESQLYHIDHDAIRQFKIFVFISDVDEQSGPLTFIPAKLSQEISRKHRYDFGKGARLRDEEIYRYVSKDQSYVVTGKSGTVAFMDASQVFHYGSRVSTKDRYMVVFQYLPITSFVYNPLYRLEPYPYAHLIRPEHNALARAVLNPDAA